MKHHAWLHFLYSSALITNIMVLMIYWPFMHKHAIKKMAKQPIIGNYRVKHMYMVHTFPALACLLNTLATNCILKRDFWKVVLQMGLIFILIQFVLIKTSGIILYEFINFHDGWRTYFAITVILTTTSIIYHL